MNAVPEENKLPYNIILMIHAKWYDSCIDQYMNKTMDNSEKKCIEECSFALADAAEVFYTVE